MSFWVGRWLVEFYFFKYLWIGDNVMVSFGKIKWYVIVNLSLINLFRIKRFIEEKNLRCFNWLPTWIRVTLKVKPLTWGHESSSGLPSIWGVTEIKSVNTMGMSSERWSSTQDTLANERKMEALELKWSNMLNPYLLYLLIYMYSLYLITSHGRECWI